jgi:hypothetical protein
VVALLNQYLKSNGVGNINPAIYSMGQNNPSVFNDIAGGNNIAPCASDSPGCNSSGHEGYNAGPGYDLATGFGSVNVGNFVQQWSAAAPTGAILTASACTGPCTSNGNGQGGGTAEQNYSMPIYETSSNQWTVQLSLTESAGIAATLTGFTVNGASLTSQIDSIFGTSSIGARQTISGSYTFTATNTPALTTLPANTALTYSGVDAKANQWSTSLTLPFEGPATMAACYLDGGGTVNLGDAQLALSQALGITSLSSALGSSGAFTVAAVQIVINASLGMGCTLQ